MISQKEGISQNMVDSKELQTQFTRKPTSEAFEGANILLSAIQRDQSAIRQVEDEGEDKQTRQKQIVTIF